MWALGSACFVFIRVLCACGVWVWGGGGGGVGASVRVCPCAIHAPPNRSVVYEPATATRCDFNPSVALYLAIGCAPSQNRKIPTGQAQCAHLRAIIMVWLANAVCYS